MEESYIHARVTTNSKYETMNRKGTTFYIAVKEKAERGQANKRVRELLAQSLGCTVSQLRLVKGGSTPSKTYLLVNRNHHEN